MQRHKLIRGGEPEEKGRVGASMRPFVELARSVLRSGQAERVGRLASRNSARGMYNPIFLGAVVCVPMVGISAVHLPVLLFCAVLTAVALGIALGQARVVSARDTLPVVVLAALSAYTLVQALPIPMRVLEHLSSSSADIWKRALLPTGEGERGWGHLSLDPGGSLVEAVKWAMYAGVFWLSVNLARSRGAQLGIAIVFASSLLAAVLTVGHGLLGATRVFGV